MVKAQAIDAADAVKLFKGVKVQTATPVKIKGDDGKERPGFKTDVVGLGADHIIAAKDHGDRVAITTIDGRKYEASKRAA